MAAIICAYDWDCDTALRIVWCESRYVATAVSRGGHRGWWQFYDGHIYRFERRGWSWDDAFVPERATAIAYELYREQGWQPWSCY